MAFRIIRARPYPVFNNFRFLLAVSSVFLLLGVHNSRMTPGFVSAEQASVLSVRDPSSPVSSTGSHVSPPCEIGLKNGSLYADCEGRDLREVPDNLPEDITEIDLYNNAIASLTNASFAMFPLLEVIILTQNKIVTIDSNTFSLLLQLRSVMLNLNKLHQLPNRLFSGNQRLKMIDLSKNNFSHVPVNVLDYHNKLSRFAFDYNNITKLNFTGSPHLYIEYFQLWSLNISSVRSDDLIALSSSTLHVFSLRGNKLTTLPDDAFENLVTVKNLDLGTNILKDFNLNSIRGMSSLRALSVYWNKITSITRFSNITNATLIPPLENLTISQNRIKTLPSRTFVYLARLEYMDLSRNRIKELHNDSLEGLINLQYLDLSRNSIEYVNKNVFSGLERLHTINMRNNKLTILDSANFSGLTPLKFLDLSFNTIQSINLNTSWMLPSIDTFDLSRNLIESLTGHPFMGLISLKCLILSENPIKVLGSDVFAGLSDISDLKLSLLGTVPNMDRPFDSLSTIKSLDLSQTYFVTDSRTFSGLKSLTYLNIAETGRTAYMFGPRNRSLLRPITELQFLNMQGNSLNGMFPWTFCALPNLRTLDLSRSRIEVLHPDIFSGLHALKTLQLQKNNIQDVSPQHLRDAYSLQFLILKLNQLKGIVDKNLFTGQTNLTFVDLSHNAITGFTDNTVLPMKTLVVAENPMSCECDSQWFRKYIAQSSLVLANADLTLCSEKSLPALAGKPYLTFKPDQVCGPRIDLYVGTSIGVLLCLLLIALAYRSRWWINYKCFHLKLLVVGYYEIEDLREHLDYVYDLNIIFPDDDEAWVMGEFIECVERHLQEFDRQRIVCGADELPLGGTRLDAIDYVIENSFKTLIIVSLASVHDVHFMTQLQMAVEHMNEVELEKVVLVFREDIPDNQLPYLVRLFLSKNKPYFRWSDDRNGQIYFWQKLTKVLRVNRKINSLLPL